jgi:hypothetical protein
MRYKPLHAEMAHVAELRGTVGRNGHVTQGALAGN